MSEPVLELRGVGKCYRTYRSNLARFGNWFGVPTEATSEFWAVKDISTAMGRGECIAFIGPNGAGKSTLLKLVTGTVYPTTGNIVIRGAVSAILELGIGFNPEMTGRQNVYQAGGMAGHSHETLTRLMPEIEAFAEIDKFFDEPVRTYSSGMHARLAFALATAVRPDILIVDEVLSVGDTYFQHKSFDRIRKFRAEGTSILLVTHGMASVLALCDRVILLEQGRILKDGQPDEVVDFYNAMIAARDNERAAIEQVRDQGWLKTRSGTGQAATTGVRLLDVDTGQTVATATVGQELVIEVDVEIREPLPQLVLGLQLRDRTGHVVWGTNTWFTKQMLHDLKPGERIAYRVPFRCTLGPGSYSITHALHNTETHITGNFEWVDNNIVFEVINASLPIFIGTSYLNAKFQIAREQGPVAEAAKVPSDAEATGAR